MKETTAFPYGLMKGNKHFCPLDSTLSQPLLLLVNFLDAQLTGSLETSFPS